MLSQGAILASVLGLAFGVICMANATEPQNVSPAGTGFGSPGSVPLDLGPAVRELGSFSAAGWTAGELVTEGLPPVASEADQTLLALREYKIVGLASRPFQRGQRRIVGRIYKFETPQGAYGAYTSLRRGATTVVTRGDASSEDDQSISFWQDHYFIYVATTAEDDDEAKEMMRTLATALAGSVQKHVSLPKIFSDLPQLDRVAGSERMIMGPVVAGRVLTIPYVAALSIEHARVAACADYQFKVPRPERMKLLLIDYGDTRLASESYKRYCDTLEGNHDQLTSGHNSLYRLPGSFMQCQIRGKMVAVISGARGRHSPMFLARQLDLTLPPVDSAASSEVAGSTTSDNTSSAVTTVGNTAPGSAAASSTTPGNTAVGSTTAGTTAPPASK